MPEEKPKTLPQLPFQDQAYFEKIKAEFYNTVAFFDQVKRAFGLLRNLQVFLKTHPEFPKEQPELFAEYEKIMTHAAFVAIPMLREQEIIDLFHDHFKEAFDINIDFKDKLIGKLVVIIMYEDRDVFRENVEKALLNNESALVDTPVVNTQTGEQLRRVNQFLRDYVRVLGVDLVNKLKVNEFLVKSYNINQLSEDVQMKLRTLFDFFNFLKYSSFDLESGEEPFIEREGDKILIRRGREVDDTDHPDINKVIEELKQAGIVFEDENAPETAAGMVSAEALQKRWADFTAGEMFRQIERKRKELGDSLKMTNDR